MIDLEHRTLAAEVEVREAAETADSYEFRGLVTATDTWYEVGDFREQIEAGAFDAHLRSDPNIYLLVSHRGLPLATTGAETMEVSTSERGVEIAARLDKGDPEAQSIAAKVRRGDVTGMSVGMRIVEDAWREVEGGKPERTITRADLLEASITPWPANPQTAAEIRAKRGTMADTDTNITATERSDDRLDALEQRVTELEGNLTAQRRERDEVDNARRQQWIADAWAAEAALLQVGE